MAEAQGRDLLSDEHFTVDGTLVEAWASQKSFQKKDAEPGSPPDDRGHPTVNFRQQKRRNETHPSTTDPEARLARKRNGKEAKLSYAGQVLMESCDQSTAAPSLTPALTPGTQRQITILASVATSPPTAQPDVGESSRPTPGR